MTLDLRHLRLFEAVYTSASITRAAERLALGQPTVSLGLGQLRRHFADPLFVFAGQRMSPTPLADALIGRVREVLDGAHEIATWRNDFDPASATRVFTLAMTDASHLTLLPRLFARIRAAAPRSSSSRSVPRPTRRCRRARSTSRSGSSRRSGRRCAARSCSRRTGSV